MIRLADQMAVWYACYGTDEVTGLPLVYPKGVSAPSKSIARRMFEEMRYHFNRVVGPDETVLVDFPDDIPDEHGGDRT